ncbi:MAG TPA: transglutaminase domain-containing protein [Polyangiales bacterium]|nr:transglutaminase domain-containing protein [Polyangiales bacterium]
MRIACAHVLVVLALAPLAAAQEEPLLHERIPNISPSEAQISQPMRAHGPPPSAADSGGSASGDSESRASMPERVPAPTAQGFRPDRQTSLEGGLDYYEAFDPAIAPFKRVTAFDDVRLDTDGKTPVLGVREPQMRIVPIESQPRRMQDRSARDRFTGDIDVDFRSGRLQPLPSVSPESRVYSVSTTPQISVQIEQDAAGNFFVQARGPIPDRPVHLRFQTDAPRSYFGSEVPSIPLRDLPKLPPIDAAIERRARRFAAELGITARSDLRSAVMALTEHFRSFVESAEAPENTGDLYLDLVRGLKGLCRHRAYGFVVTARGLGIEARFVQNEAHSWVEVALPDIGFMRIDLGGATHGLTAHGAMDRQSYVPMQPDTLPRPDAYRQSYAQAARQAPPTAAPNDAEVLASLSGRWLSDESLMSSNPSRPDNTGIEQKPARSEKRAVHIALEDRRVTALRGGKLVLTGQLLDNDQRGVPGLRVEIWILRPARHQRMLLAVQVSDQDGYFRADFGVPPDLSVGDYRLIARSQGDGVHLPSSSE